MTIQQLLNKIKQYAIKQSASVSKVAPEQTSKLVAKINNTFSAKNVGAAAGKIVGAVATANITDSLIKDVPVANNIYQWYANTWDDIYESTVRKIPVVGKVLRNISDFINRLVVPNAQRGIEQHRSSRVNDPKFYTELDMHTAFTIPFGYPDNVAIPFADGRNYSSIAVYKLGLNPMVSKSKIRARYTQLLDLLKGIRGLSGQLPYTEGDLYFYDWNTNYLMTEYYRLKFALKLSRMYVLTKTLLPKSLLNNLGWDADNFIANRAQYVSILTQMSNFMTNSVPMFGMFKKRIESLFDKLIPDSNDGKVALLYCMDLRMVTVIPRGTTYDRYTAFFVKSANAYNPGNTGISLKIGSTTGMNYATYVNNYRTFENDFLFSDRIYATIKGDLVGAFGSKVTWTDSNINEVNTITSQDLVHKFDELFLTQLQNATITEQIGVDYLSNNTTASMLPDDSYILVTMPTIDGNGSVNDMMIPSTSTSDTAKVFVEMRATNSTGVAGTIFAPGTDGIAEYNTGSQIDTSETVVIGNKYNYSEGEQLEILQLTAMAEAAGIEYDGNDHFDAYLVGYITNTVYLSRIELLYYDAKLHTPTGLILRPTAFALSAGNTGAMRAQYTMNSIQMWTQADYGTKFNIEIVDPSATPPYGLSRALLLDFNIMGSISKSAFEVAKDYAAYSLYSANIGMDSETGKRISNIVGVYKIRS